MRLKKLAGALWCLMFVEFTSAGDNDLVLDYGQRALALAREPGLSELIGRTLNNLCIAFVVQKQLKLAREAVVESQHIWRALGNLPRFAEAHRYLANIHNVVGDYKQLLEETARLIELGASIGSRLDPMQGLIFSAIAYGRQGRFEKGQDCIERAGTLASAIGHLNEKHDHLWERIELYLSAGA
jgi:tetratricopeptide (TPR) repeat protein